MSDDLIAVIKGLLILISIMGLIFYGFLNAAYSYRQVYTDLTPKRFVKFKVVKNGHNLYLIKYKWLMFWKWYSECSNEKTRYTTYKEAIEKIEKIKEDLINEHNWNKLNNKITNVTELEKTLEG